MAEAPLPVIPMRVGGIVVDPNTQAPIVVLRGLDEPAMYLPIFIGGMEATAIATALAGLEMPRPMTHDLMASVLGELHTTVRRVTVTHLIEGTFYAELSLADAAGHEYAIDARPSDSIALAVRVGAAIYVARPVLEEAGGISEDGPEDGAREAIEAARAEQEDKAIASAPSPVVGTDVRLEDLDPETFGKYKM